MPPPRKKKLPSADFPSPRFDPFRRTDRYGARGCAPQPPLEVFRGAVTALALAPLKLFVTLSAVVFFYLVCRFSPLLFRDEQRRARVVTLLGRRCARLALLGLGFVSVRYESVGRDELPPGYPLSPPAEEAGTDGAGGIEGVGGGDGGDGGDGRRKKGSRRSAAATTASSSSSPVLAAGAIVSNHCGWIDVLIHMAAPPYRPSSSSSATSSSSSASPSTPQQQLPLSSPFPSFVARASTEELPLIGVIAKEIGCLYVDRSKAAGASGIAALVRERVAAAAEAGGRRRRGGKSEKGGGSSSLSSSSSPSVLWPPPLLLFPEGTTTNGRYLLRFKTGAFLAGAPVAPVLLSYGPSPGFRFNPSWESIAAGRHALLLLMQPWLSAVVRRLPAYYPDSAERTDPALYASRVREAMLAVGDFAPSDSTIADKWEYQALLQGKPPRPPPPPVISSSGSQQQQQQQQQQQLTNGGGGAGGKARKGSGVGGALSFGSSSEVAARASSGDVVPAGFVKRAS